MNNDTTLYAQWNPIEYSITYNLDGGTNDTDNPDKYTIESNITLKSPTKSGYTFEGWYTKSDFSGDSISSISNRTGDIELYAKWANSSTPSPGTGGKLGIPEVNKTLTAHQGNSTEVGGDGTYDLTLSFTAHEKLSEVESKGKADITFIFDNSDSMQDEYSEEDQTKKKLTVAKEALNNMAGELLKYNVNNPDAIRLSLIAFGNKAEIKTFGGIGSTRQYTTDAEEFSTTVGNCNPKIESLTTQGGTTSQAATNWEDALEKTNELRTEVNTPIRQSADHYVIFISDGNPTFRNTLGNYYELDNTYSPSLPKVNDCPFNNSYVRGANTDYIGTGCDITDKIKVHGEDYERYSMEYYQATNYQGAVHYGRYDKSPTNTYGYLVMPNATNVERCYEQSLDNAKDLVNAGVNFYSVSTYGSTSSNTHMQTLLNAAYNNGNDSISTNTPSGHYYTASNSSEIADALNEITGHILTEYMYSNVTLYDELTGLTMIDDKENRVTWGDDHEADPASGESKFVYYKYGGTYGGTADDPSTWTQFDPNDDHLNYATYDESSGKVIWNIIGDRQHHNDTRLEDGVTYAVKFRVWPAQNAYDEVAARKNRNAGTITHTDNYTDQITYNEDNGKYYLETNNNAKASYSIASQKTTTPSNPSEDVVTNTPQKDIDLPNPPDIPLTCAQITITKAWDSGSHPDEATFTLKGGPRDIRFTLNSDNNWTKTIYVSPGLKVTSPSETILDTGYEYTLEEDSVSGYEPKITPEGSIKPFLNDSASTITPNGGTYTYNVLNKKTETPSTELPDSGGHGTLLYTLIGLLITGSALVAGVASRRSRRKEGWN